LTSVREEPPCCLMGQSPGADSTYAGGRRGKERAASLRAEQRLAAGGRRLPRPEPRPVRGVAAGRSAQRACERSSDWRRGAAGSPDPEHVVARACVSLARFLRLLYGPPTLRASALEAWRQRVSRCSILRFR